MLYAICLSKWAMKDIYRGNLEPAYFLTNWEKFQCFFSKLAKIRFVAQYLLLWATFTETATR